MDSFAIIIGKNLFYVLLSLRKIPIYFEGLTSCVMNGANIVPRPEKKKPSDTHVFLTTVGATSMVYRNTTLNAKVVSSFPITLKAIRPPTISGEKI